jgi:hypothetical protein
MIVAIERALVVDDEALEGPSRRRRRDVTP